MKSPSLTLGVISKLMNNSGDISQITLTAMWLLLLIKFWDLWKLLIYPKSTYYHTVLNTSQNTNKPWRKSTHASHLQWPSVSPHHPLSTAQHGNIFKWPGWISVVLQSALILGPHCPSFRDGPHFIPDAKRKHHIIKIDTIDLTEGLDANHWFLCKWYTLSDKTSKWVPKTQLGE